MTTEIGRVTVHDCAIHRKSAELLFMNAQMYCALTIPAYAFKSIPHDVRILRSYREIADIVMDGKPQCPVSSEKKKKSTNLTHIVWHGRGIQPTTARLRG